MLTVPDSGATERAAWRPQRQTEPHLMAENPVVRWFTELYDFHNSEVPLAAQGLEEPKPPRKPPWLSFLVAVDLTSLCWVPLGVYSGKFFLLGTNISFFFFFSCT